MQNTLFKIWSNAKIFLMTDNEQHHFIERGAVVTHDKSIVWVGNMSDLPAQYLHNHSAHYDVESRVITPGLIDCHTHVVYGGNRANEFSLKLQGVSYEEILLKGGGIHATVNATRALSETELMQQSLKRVKQFVAEGVTSLEIKSGYGLDYQTERKMLLVAREIGKLLSLNISTTFLGAHVLPREYTNKKAYLEYLVVEVLPNLVKENLVDAVDAFCDKIAFDTEELENLFSKARDLSLNLKLHSDQLTNSKGAHLAGRFQAWSVDHLEYIDEASIQVLANSNTVAVLLPGAYYYLQERQKPPVDLLRKHKVPIAIATDCNPGSSPCLSLLTILNMACVLFRLTPFEAFKAVTRNAAQALGWSDKKGQIKVGFDADFVVWDINHPDELSYYIGANPCVRVINGGEIIYEK